MLSIAFNIPDLKLPLQLVASSYPGPSRVDSDNAASALYRPLGTLLESRPQGQGEPDPIQPKTVGEVPLSRFLW